MFRFSKDYSRNVKRNKTDIAGNRLHTPDWNRVKLRPFKKNFYRETESVSERSPSRIQDFYLKHDIVIKGHNVPKPIMHFSDVSLPSSIRHVIRHNQWKSPTPIQSLGWPFALSGRDVVGIARTGSGKTAAFIVPAIVHILAQEESKSNDGPICLVLVPTRELAQQVNEVAEDFCKAVDIRSVCLYGGAPKHTQRDLLLRNPQLVIATPGRVLDFLECGVTNLKRCTFLVLDEADRMLDMGFEPQIRRILKQVRPDRQTVMWSATWPKDVQAMAKDFLSDYIQVSVGDLRLRANPNIVQNVEVMSEMEKQPRLFELLQSFNRRDRVLIFVETKKNADTITYNLRRRGFSAVCMHGDKAQQHREEVLESFRQGETSILVATDVASRGLDIDDIKYVVNYDYPSVSEDYIHRIGRTGRSDKKGSAFTFMTSRQGFKAKELIRVLQESNQHVPNELTRLANSNLMTQSRNQYGNGSQGIKRWCNPSDYLSPKRQRVVPNHKQLRSRSRSPPQSRPRMYSRTSSSSRSSSRNSVSRHMHKVYKHSRMRSPSPNVKNARQGNVNKFGSYERKFEYNVSQHKIQSERSRTFNTKKENEKRLASSDESYSSSGSSTPYRKHVRHAKLRTKETKNSTSHKYKRKSSRSSSSSSTSQVPKKSSRVHRSPLSSGSSSLTSKHRNHSSTKTKKAKRCRKSSSSSEDDKTRQTTAKVHEKSFVSSRSSTPASISKNAHFNVKEEKLVDLKRYSSQSSQSSRNSSASENPKLSKGKRELASSRRSTPSRERQLLSKVPDKAFAQSRVSRSSSSSRSSTPASSKPRYDSSPLSSLRMASVRDGSSSILEKNKNGCTYEIVKGPSSSRSSSSSLERLAINQSPKRDNALAGKVRQSSISENSSSLEKCARQSATYSEIATKESIFCENRTFNDEIESIMALNGDKISRKASSSPRMSSVLVRRESSLPLHSDHSRRSDSISSASSLSSNVSSIK